jgi:transposase
MKRRKFSTKVAGIDVSKKMLDVAVHGIEDGARFGNGADGVAQLEAWLKARGVGRVGLEASGGYERAAVARLQAAGFEVVVHQPLEIRLYARLRRAKAKNDRFDARIIAAATAQIETVKAANDPLLAELCERVTAYEQASEAVARLKACLEHVSLPDLKAQYAAQLRNLLAWKRSLANDLVKRIKADAGLRLRHELLTSLPGVGQLIAAVLVVRMPELGAMKHGQPSAMIGVAPYDRDSGQFKGQRFIWGGRARPRRFLYLAALAAKRFAPDFKAFANRLLDAGKPKKLVVVATMRKLIEAANLVLVRGSPWIAQPQV